MSHLYLACGPDRYLRGRSTMLIPPLLWFPCYQSPPSALTALQSTHGTLHSCLRPRDLVRAVRDPPRKRSTFVPIGSVFVYSLHTTADIAHPSKDATMRVKPSTNSKTWKTIRRTPLNPKSNKSSTANPLKTTATLTCRKTPAIPRSTVPSSLKMPAMEWQPRARSTAEVLLWQRGLYPTLPSHR